MNKLNKLLFVFMCFSLLSCNENNSSSLNESQSNEDSIPISSTDSSSSLETSSNENSSNEEEKDYIASLSKQEKDNLSIQGYASFGIQDFSKYINTDYYRVVSNEEEFIKAIYDAKYDYETIWDDSTNTYTQNLIKEGSVRVIEITNDLNLGYNKLSENSIKLTQVVSDYANKYNTYKDSLYLSDMFLENGISQIKIEKTSNLMIYSKSGVKITYAGFKLTSCDNVVFRNIFFDELWQWEDAVNASTSKIGDYDYFGWSYFKIGFCGYVWIDHCKFGKSYDGQIDYANANYHSTKSTSFRAPYGSTGGKGLSVTWCDFSSGDDNQEGYLYKMMNKLEQDYQNNDCKALYYKTLRENGVSFNEILYGLAIPQKKGFLIGDDQDYKQDNHVEYDYNLELFVTFANCRFTDLEDRLPKVRGGNVYMHNCLFDSSKYYEYRKRLSSINASNIVKKVNTSWKCALVSQGIVCGQGGSVKAINCIFLGINTLLKNNDSGSIAPFGYGGFDLQNCRYVKDNIDYTGSSSDKTHQFSNSSTSTLKTDYFKWNTIDGNEPYEVKVLIELDKLEDNLKNDIYGVGIKNTMKQYMLVFKYN